jgi:hypothetical protein
MTNKTRPKCPMFFFYLLYVNLTLFFVFVFTYMILQYKHNIHIHVLSENIKLICACLKTGRKDRQKLAFLPVSKGRTNKFYISRQCTYNVYPCQNFFWTQVQRLSLKDKFDRVNTPLQLQIYELYLLWKVAILAVFVR